MWQIGPGKAQLERGKMNDKSISARFPTPAKGSWGAVKRHLDGSQQELMGVWNEEQTTNQGCEIFPRTERVSR